MDVTRSTNLQSPGSAVPRTPRFFPLERELHATPELAPLDLSRHPAGPMLPLDGARHARPEFAPVASAQALNAPGPALHAEQELRRQAQNFVSQAFFGTLLRQARNSPFRSELFDGGRGGQAFGSLYDQHLADRMARGAGGQLADAIVRKLRARQAYARQDWRLESIDGRGRAPDHRG